MFLLKVFNYNFSRTKYNMNSLLAMNLVRALNVEEKILKGGC